MQNLEFHILLTQNYYTNPNSFQICFPIEIKSLTNINNGIGDSLITVNNFFAHWIKEINIKRCGDDAQTLRTSSPYEIYQYSDAMLKHC